ncbi:hypothetical protein BDQ17DRAFT_1335349 [Cyathus striatus]|nr:hypothetical protein BDQ17DRAFT_1335349 [Cyathus striatus]
MKWVSLEANIIWINNQYYNQFGSIKQVNLTASHKGQLDKVTLRSSSLSTNTRKPSATNSVTGTQQTQSKMALNKAQETLLTQLTTQEAQDILHQESYLELGCSKPTPSSKLKTQTVLDSQLDRLDHAVKRLESSQSQASSLIHCLKEGVMGNMTAQVDGRAQDSPMGHSSYANVLVSAAAPHSIPIKLSNPQCSNPNDVGNLILCEWVVRANLALNGIPESTSPCPEGALIVAAHQAGNQIILEANSASTAGWLKEKEVIASFISHFNGSSMPNLSLFSVIAEFVPTSFHPMLSTVFDDIEVASGLKLGSIMEAKPLKDPGYWKEDQCFAHFLFAFSDQKSANQAIFHGLVVEGTRV